MVAAYNAFEVMHNGKVMATELNHKLITDKNENTFLYNNLQINASI